MLQADYPRAKITMVDRRIGGQEAQSELQRFDTDVVTANPDLVIWQAGTNAVWQPLSENPPSFEETASAIRSGLLKLRNQCRRTSS